MPQLPAPTWRKWAIAGGAVGVQAAVLCLPAAALPLPLVAAGGCLIGAAMLTLAARYVAVRKESTPWRQTSELVLHMLSVAAWTFPLVARLALPALGVTVGILPALAAGIGLSLAAFLINGYRVNQNEATGTAAQKRSTLPSWVDGAEALGYMTVLLPLGLWGGVPVMVGAVCATVAGAYRVADPCAQGVLATRKALKKTPGMADHDRVLDVYHLTTSTALLLRLITSR